MARFGFQRSIQTRVLSSVYGKIETLLLAFPGKRGEVTSELVEARFGSIFKAFNDRVTFVVLGHFGDDEELCTAREYFSQVLVKHKIDPSIHLHLVHTPRAGGHCKRTHDIHSEFVQDPFLVMETEHNHVVLLEPIEQGNPANQNVAEQLADGAGFLIRPTQLFLEGGNILVGDDFACVGMNLLVENAPLAPKKHSGEPKDWIEMQLKELLGVRYIVWVGTVTPLNFGYFHSTGGAAMQPFFHLDLFLTLLGKTSNGKECAILAKIDLELVQGATEDQKAMLRQVNETLDHIENLIEKSGTDYPGPIFEVHRNEIAGKVITTDLGPTFVPFPFNNAWVEQYQQVRRIYFPSFGHHEALEAKFKDLLKRLQFDVVKPIENRFEYYAENGGSLHCISTVLKRSAT